MNHVDVRGRALQTKEVQTSWGWPALRRLHRAEGRVEGGEIRGETGSHHIEPSLLMLHREQTTGRESRHCLGDFCEIQVKSHAT